MSDQNFRVSPGLEIGSGNTSVTINAGIITASGGFNIGIQSSGINVSAGVITALNFTGAGNTFLYNSATKTIDISIAGGGGGSSAVINKQSFSVGVGGTDTFILTESYSTGYIDVYLNGVRLATGDFTETPPNTIVLTTAAENGDIVEFQSFTNRVENTTLESTVDNLRVTGIATLGSSNGIGTVTVGIGSTALFVDGNARITGILSIGQGTVTIDGNTNTVTATNIVVENSITTCDNVGYATEGYVDAAVAGVSTFSGDYNDLTNKPSIPTDTGDLTNNVGFITATSSGSSLTGIVTSITAGSGISVDQSTGNVTITATGGGGGGGSWTQIGIQTASSSASIEFNDLNSTYKKYRIEILYVIPATDNVNFYLFFSDNNNSTIFTNNYAWTFDGGSSSIVTRVNGQITVTTVSNTKYGNFTIDLYGMGTNIEPYAKTFGTYFDATPNFRNSDGSIMRNVATTTNAVTIKYSSGNIAEGTFILYGLS